MERKLLRIRSKWSFRSCKGKLYTITTLHKRRKENSWPPSAKYRAMGANLETAFPLDNEEAQLLVKKKVVIKSELDQRIVELGALIIILGHSL